MAEKLRPFSYVVLALVGRDGAGPHDMVRMMRRGRLYWSAAESHWYAEPKRLAGLGYLSAEGRPGRTTERTHYTLTDRGLDELRDWLGRPSAYPRIQNEAVVRVLASDLGDPTAVARSMEGLRSDIAELEAGLDAAEADIPALPHRARALRLVHALGRETLRVHREWAERVERELGTP
jgi:DNA-binding PadR family transcriptional regulator